MGRGVCLGAQLGARLSSIGHTYQCWHQGPNNRWRRCRFSQHHYPVTPADTSANVVPGWHTLRRRNMDRPTTFFGCCRLGGGHMSLRYGMTLSCEPIREKRRTGMTTSGILQNWTFSALSALSEKQGEFPIERMSSFQFFLFRA